MDSIALLQYKYQDRVKFISLTNDDNYSIIGRLKEEKGFNWDFLYTGSNISFFEDYRIRSLPAYILLDNKGKIVAYPAISNSQGFKSSFQNLFRD